MTSTMSPPRGSQSGPNPRKPIFEGPKFNPNAVGARAYEAARHPIKTSLKIGKAIVFATGLYTIMLHSPVGDALRDVTGSGLVKAGQQIETDNSNTSEGQGGQQGSTPTASSSEQERLSELQARLPKGTRLIITSAAAGDGAWNIVHRVNPALNVHSVLFNRALAYVVTEPNVSDGLQPDEKVQVPQVPVPQTPPTTVQKND